MVGGRLTGLGEPQLDGQTLDEGGLDPAHRPGCGPSLGMTSDLDGAVDCLTRLLMTSLPARARLRHTTTPSSPQPYPPP